MGGKSDSLENGIGFLAGGGRARDLILARDWSDHPLGPPAGWPDGLKTALSLVLNSPESMILCWDAEDLWFFFNETYFPLLGPRLDWAMGARFDQVWADGLDQARPIIRDAFEGRSPRFVDLPWRLDTDRGAADTWWTFSYSRILDADGRVAGLFIFTNETTERVRADAALNESRAALAASEAEWRGIFQSLGEGLVLGEIVRDTDGRAIDWRYRAVNPAWSALTGIDDANISGRTAREVVPSLEQAWIDDFIGVVETGRPLTFQRPVGPLGRSYEGRAFALADDKFAVIFRDITEDLRETDRQSALIEIGDLIRDSDKPAEMCRRVSRHVGERLGLCRAAFGRVAGDVEEVEIEPNWTAPGVNPIVGRFRFEDFGDIRDDLRTGQALVITDVHRDPRTRGQSDQLAALGIGSLVNMPVQDKGRTIAVLIAQASTPREWTAAELRFLRKVADRLEAGLARLEAERRRSVMALETTHRLKNTLAMVHAIAVQTLRGVDAAKVHTFEKRLMALAASHDDLTQNDWARAELDQIVRRAVGNVVGPDRFCLSGPSVTLSDAAAQNTTLVLHELATNAVKHGSVSRPSGSIDIRWTVEDSRLTLYWREIAGPPVTPPTQRGFGSRLIGLGLLGEGGAHLDYAPDGLVACFTAPLDRL